jgi:23S rRNA (cytosine1962-C5)-methyltransferase
MGPHHHPPLTKTLQVSRATARFLADGHPWVRPDRHTHGLDALRPGEAVTLVDAAGLRLASALADPGHEICARVYHKKPDMAFRPLDALGRAWDRRAALHADPDTNCYRLVHGEGDYLPGLRIERYADTFVVLVLAPCAAPYADALGQALLARHPGAVVVRRDHQEDLRREAATTRFLAGGAEADAIVLGRELGVTYPLRPYAGLATGLYVDQRATRQWLRARAPGARVLNLFAYTGAFSLTLLAAGAALAVDVDLAGPALKRAEEAAAMNGLAARHQAVKADCRSFLAKDTERWDIIVCDPPTAAQGGDGWVLRRDYPEVLGLALQRLAPSGLLLACCNTTFGKAYPLAEVLLSAAREAEVRVREVPHPALGADLPQLHGFPEGRPFRLVAVERDPR